MSKRVLVVEDEPDIAALLKLHLTDLFDEVVHSDDGREGLSLATGSRWDLVMLDIRLPGVDGLEICRQLRQGSEYTPILMLTAKSTELDRVLGLEIGADDYVTKPFSTVELLARAKALLRRASAMDKKDEVYASKLQFERLSIDTESREVCVADQAVELTAKEFELLLYFARHPGKAFKRSELLDAVWGYGHDGYDHTVNSHINRLRAKIESDPVNPEYIATIWGVGYKFTAQAKEGTQA